MGIPAALQDRTHKGPANFYAWDEHGSLTGIPAGYPDGTLVDPEDRILRDPGGMSRTGPVSGDRRGPDGTLTVVLAGQFDRII